MKLTKRLSTLASFVPKNKIVYDIGCDHALLDIYLTLYNGNTCFACDIKESALNFAKKNISKYQLEEKIETIVSDGFENIDVKDNSVAVISGMGTNTILTILENEKVQKLDSIILQTNNEYPLLRKKISEMGYKIVDESTLFEKGIHYIFMKIEKGKSHYSKIDLEFGPILRKNDEMEVLVLYRYLFDNKLKVFKKLPRGHLGKKVKLIKELRWLRKKIKKWEY